MKRRYNNLIPTCLLEQYAMTKIGGCAVRLALGLVTICLSFEHGGLLAFFIVMASVATMGIAVSSMADMDRYTAYPGGSDLVLSPLFTLIGYALMMFSGLALFDLQQPHAPVAFTFMMFSCVGVVALLICYFMDQHIPRHLLDNEQTSHQAVDWKTMRREVQRASGD